MKIISKFKDFYDYKVAKYGVDEKLIYNRKTCCDYYKMKFQYLNLHKNIPEKVSIEDFNNILKEHIKFFDKTNHNKILFFYYTTYRTKACNFSVLQANYVEGLYY